MSATATKRFPIDFPDKYVVIDIETSGLDRDRNLVLSVGWCKVIDAQKTPDGSGSLILDWTAVENIDQAQLDADMAACRAQIGAGYRFDRELLETGQHPFEALRNLGVSIARAISQGFAFVGHNSWWFDLPFLETSIERCSANFTVVPRDRLWDTMLLEKAAGIGMSFVPFATRRDSFYRNISETRSTYKTNLGLCCDRRGIKRDGQAQHGALYDCLLTHQLLEAMRNE